MIDIEDKVEENVTEVNEVQAEQNNGYELRGLRASDLGAICKIISAIGIKEFKKCLESDDVKALIKGGNAEAVGIGIMFDVAGIITSNIPRAEKEILAFVSSVSGLKMSEVLTMPLADYGELIIRIVMLPDFKDFFGRAFKLFK